MRKLAQDRQWQRGARPPAFQAGPVRSTLFPRTLDAPRFPGSPAPLSLSSGSRGCERHPPGAARAPGPGENPRWSARPWAGRRAQARCSPGWAGEPLGATPDAISLPEAGRASALTQETLLRLPAAAPHPRLHASYSPRVARGAGRPPGDPPEELGSHRLGKQNPWQPEQ